MTQCTMGMLRGCCENVAGWKSADYAQVGISEYWIVNPLDETVTVLRLEDRQYVEDGVFQRGSIATSVLLAGVEVDVDAVFEVT